MKTVSIRNMGQHAGTSVGLQGWSAAVRSSGKLVFVLLRDGTGMCQCVVSAETPAAWNAARTLGVESSVRIAGTVRADERAPGGFELLVEELNPIQIAPEYPIARKAHGTDFLMQHRHLWLRAPRQIAILRIRHTLIRAMRSFFDRNEFTLIDTPILAPGAAEGAGTLFSVDFFGQEVNLAQTGQLYLEAAALALGKVYCFGPTFRAEKSKTRRHLAEFWMIEPEIAFAELPELTEWAEQFVADIVQAVLRECTAELALLERDVAPLQAVQAPFPRITYSEAVDLLHSEKVRDQLQTLWQEDRKRLEILRERLQSTEAQRAEARKRWQQEKLDREIAVLREEVKELDRDLENRARHIEDIRSFSWGNDLGGDEETVLSRLYDRPLIITEYPRRAKAFYMKPRPDHPEVVLNFDMIAPEGYGEIIGGSQREEGLEALEARMREEQMDPDHYAWYLDLRRYGSVPHGGFGLGLERTVAWVAGLKHIRETIPFPRMMGRFSP